MNVDVMIEDSTIVLLPCLYVDNTDWSSINCLTIECFITVRMKLAKGQTSLNVTMGDLTTFCANVCKLLKTNKECDNLEKYQIVDKTTVNLTGHMLEKSEENEAQFKLCIEIGEVVVHMAMVALQTVISVFTSTETEAEKIDLRRDAYDILRPIELAKNFWTPHRMDCSSDIKKMILDADNILPGSQEVIDYKALKKKHGHQVINVTIGGLFFRIETEVADNLRVPVVAVEFRGVFVNAENWSSCLKVGCYIQMELAAFSDKTGGWESVIERTSDENRPSRTQAMLVPWCFSVNVNWPAIRDTEKFLVEIESSCKLQISLSVPTLLLFRRLSDEFMSGQMPENWKHEVVSTTDYSCLSIFNRLGEDVELVLGFDLKSKEGNLVVLKDGESIPLYSNQLGRLQNSLIAHSNNHVRQELSFNLAGQNFVINLTRTLPRLFENDPTLSVLVNTECINARKTVSLSSAIKVHNLCPFEVVFRSISNGAEIRMLLSAQCQHLSVAQTALIRSDDFEIILKSYPRYRSSRRFNIKRTKKATTFVCKCEKLEKVMYVNVLVQMDAVFTGNSSRRDSILRTIVVRPCVQFINQLPIEIIINDLTIQPGQQSSLLDKSFDDLTNFSESSQITVKFIMNDVTFESVINITNERHSTVRHVTFGSVKILAIYQEFYLAKSPPLCLKLFAPYWVCDTTKLPLHIKLLDDRDQITPICSHNQILMLCDKKINKGKRRAQLAINDPNCQWSKVFSLDTLGSTGSLSVVNPTNPLNSYNVCVTITYSSCGLTKIISLMPFHALLNKATVPIEVCEVTLTVEAGLERTSEIGRWILVKSGDCVPFWPADTHSGNSLIIIKLLGGQKAKSRAFHFRKPHTTLLKIGQSEAIFVECNIREFSCHLVFSNNDRPGQAPLLVVNCSCVHSLQITQEGDSKGIAVPSNSMQYFTWTKPSSIERRIRWTCDKHSATNMNLTEAAGTFTVDSDNNDNEMQMFWKVLVIMNQRVFIVYGNNDIVARPSGSSSTYKLNDMKSKQFTIELSYVGISLVDDRQELAYISLQSSETQWYRKNEKLRLELIKDDHLPDVIERSYQEHKSAVRLGEKNDRHISILDQRREVDFRLMELCEMPDPTGTFVKDHKATISFIERKKFNALSIR
ncbi:hypothetical protein ACOME3_001407 [Neoechinorhynchus agilis]